MYKILKIFTRNVIFFWYGKELDFIDKIKLKLAPRYKIGSVSLAGKLFQYTDAASFVSMFEEIFIRRIYEFKSTTGTPVILDCGSNIGLGIIYLKLLYPLAKVIGFEPDANIYKILTSNVAAYGFVDVQLHQAAVWSHDEGLEFIVQGGLSGQVRPADCVAANLVKVRSLRLKDFLNAPIDFLKIDIEGAEYEVIIDCKDNLQHAKFLFLEYHSSTGKSQQLDVLLSTLSLAGFRYYIQEAFTSPAPFKQVNTMLDMDLQLNIFGIKQ